MNKRVFLLVGNSLTLYEWEAKKLLGKYTFEFTELGFSLFKKTIKKMPICPAQLLVSMPNEDFYREKVPHVRRSERPIVLNRYIKKHFRNEKYTNVIFQKREKEGRKDDVVLISSIGSSDEFDKWISLIHELEVPLIGIWSVPLYLDTILKKYLQKHNNIIFVNRERCGNYRQSLFVDGSLILSRVSDGIDSSMSIYEKVNSINEFVGQLYKFSTNKRILKPDSPVVVLCAFDEVSISDLYEANSFESLQYDFLNVKQSYLDEDLVALCAKDCKRIPHYEAKDDRVKFSIFEKNKKIYKCLFFFIFFMFSSTGVIAIQSWDAYRKSDFNNSTAVDLEYAYHDRYSGIDQYLSYGISSKSLVDSIIKRQLDATPIPTDIFSALSDVLSMQNFSGIVTNHILWKRYSGVELESIDRFFADDDEDIQDSGVVFENDAVKEAIYIHISGDYFVDDITYDQAIDTMNKLHFELGEISGVNAVHMLRIPVDLRAGSHFKDFGGLLVEQQSREDERSVFEFILEYRGE